MFIYLSKKIAIPNNTRINAIAWNKEDGYIAVGGDDGLLKVLKLDAGGETDGAAKARGLVASSNLSMNQTLEGHTESIQVLVWNETHKKLTTSDQNGVIIVWMLYKGAWYEEMINNRKKSTVVGMAWSADGLKICIIYEDGAVIVGSVDGNRIWGKELKNIHLSGVQWSPDGKLLLFSLKNGQVHLYDNQGNFIMQIEIFCNEVTLELIPVVGLDWYNGQNGYMHALCPNLAICYENGRTQIMRNESDTNPVVLDTKMIAVHCSWNHNGSLLAIAGRQYNDDKEMNLVQFYNPFGEHLRTLKVPGTSIACCVWEGGSLRVALAVDSFVYFANIRPDYKWCYFKKTVVFTCCRPQKPGICVSFWDISNNQCHTVYVPILIALSGYGDHCVLVTRSELDESPGQYGLILCNTLGTAVDGKYIDIEPIAVTMNSTHVIATSKNNFIVWQYKTPKSSSVVTGARNKCRMFHIDDNPTGAVEVIQELDSLDKIVVSTHNSSDPACCIACSDKCLIIGRESGLLQYYALPHVVLTNKYKISTRPHKIAINCNSTRLSVIDVAGVMTVLDTSDAIGRPSSTTDNKLERKDVWAMCWASDNPQLLSIMEKTRMYIFKGIYPEEPVSCSGYICSFNELEIQAVLLDEIMESPERPNSKDHLIKLEVKSLRDTRQLLEKVGINEASLFIEENPHPRLWRLLAEGALREMNLSMAESAFVRSRDYARVLFVKKLKDINSNAIRKARIATYFKNFDEAEKTYMEADRSDLALSLRQTLGDWFRVIQILKNGTSAPDYLLKTAYNSAAEYFVHFNNWVTAVEYYELAGNMAEMIECYYHLEDYKKLESFVQILPEGDPLLKKIGDIFATNAVISEAVEAYCKFGNVNTAIELCIAHNRWNTAIELAKKYNMTKISDLFVKYTTHLEDQGSLFAAIDVNIQAKFYLHAAEHAYKLADLESKKHNKNLLKVKKHYVYAARLLQMHKKTPNPAEWASDPTVYENAWKGAEAYHYYMLAQEQLYSGKLHDALCTAYKLQDYTSYLNALDIYSLLALTACLDRSFGICSRALIKLTSLPEVSEAVRNQYKKLAWDIFMKNEPKDLKQIKLKCSNCGDSTSDWRTRCPKCKIHFPTCIASGRSIIEELSNTWLCSHCHHPAFESQMTFHNVCLLCHANK
ncbi:WD repeat-containing protein 35 isoform X1 [Tribolium castaneum]|uniref:WD repeat-containing protein 35 n=2 Tax=Tribolium castaneum TaxID=7070 RepID=D6W7C7_TRICA|nr:PREDICTED: WD repeat-containing protein 35 [Tribolium castaneum]EFA11044.2 WD repeat-containing protein 35-like Protein [Tribolium castaneum]|eukprot:XP_015835217.1 PREDICTED: WD repeat-containing protein 35 [Tribolium castaneum]